MLETRDLRLFVCLTEELHFARAADRLGIAQSTVSMLLRRLEDVIGAPLFERRKRATVRLTEVGAALLPEAREALAAVTRVEGVGRMAARGEAGTLDIGYIFSAALNGVLAKLLSTMRDEMPLLKPAAQLLETPRQIAAIAENKLDLGLCRPRPGYPATIGSRIVHREPLGLLVRVDHRLATAGHAQAAELSAETFLLPHFDDRFGLFEKLERLSIAGGFAAVPVRTGDFVTAASMAAAGYGIVFGPRSLAGLGVEALRFVPLLDFDEVIETALIWNKRVSALIRRLDGLSDGSLAARA